LSGGGSKKKGKVRPTDQEDDCGRENEAGRERAASDIAIEEGERRQKNVGLEPPAKEYHIKRRKEGIVYDSNIYLLHKIVRGRVGGR